MTNKSKNIKVSTKKNKKETVHVYVLMIIMCVFVAILTYIVPAGQYEREVINGRNMVIPGTYQIIENTPVGLWKLFSSVPQGWSEASSIMFLVFMVGGAIKVIEDTKVIDKVLNNSMQWFKGKEEQVVIAVSIVLSIIGATGTFSTANIAIVPIALAFSKRLGYDKVLAMALAYLAVNIGYTAGWVNVFATAISQEIAEIPKFSGIGVRLLEHAIFMAIYIIFMLRYLRKIKNNPDASIAPFESYEIIDMSMLTPEEAKLTTNQKLAGIVTIIGFGSLIYGSLVKRMSTADITTIFFIMAVAGGLLGGLGINGTAKSFANGLKGIAAGAFIVGMAKAISVVMTEGNIIDSIVYYMTMPINAVGSVLGSGIMYLFNLVFAVIISSGSGQAVAVMPIMVPMSDLTGITRQVAVEAYKLADGLTNIITPTAGAMMACLGIAEIPYTKYVKWLMPYFITTAVVGLVIVITLQLIGWNPM